jgi:hypothetical protein
MTYTEAVASSLKRVKSLGKSETLFYLAILARKLSDISNPIKRLAIVYLIK